MNSGEHTRFDHLVRDVTEARIRAHAFECGKRRIRVREREFERLTSEYLLEYSHRRARKRRMSRDVVGERRRRRERKPLRILLGIGIAVAVRIADRGDWPPEVVRVLRIPGG